MNTNRSGATGAQLAHDRIDRYRSLGVFGKPAYQSHVQLRAMLKAKRGDKVANYFARPIQDPDLGELRWTSEVRGPARAWHEMTGEEQAECAIDLEVVRSGLMSFSQELRAQSGGQPGGAASFASLLDQATRVPADGNFLYYVGNQPMIAFWGFEDQGGLSVDPLAFAPKSAPTPPAAPTPTPTPTPAPAPFIALPPDEAVQPKPLPVVLAAKRPWWRWVLIALLPLLLLGLLLFGLRACKLGGTIDPAVTAYGPNRPDGTAPPASGPAGHSPVDSMVLPGPGGTATLPPPTGDGSGTVPSNEPNGALPYAASGAPDAPSAESAGAPALPDAPDVAGVPNAPDTHAAPRLSDAREAPPSSDAGAPMALPKLPGAAKKLDFLEGEWKAGEGLVDKKTKQPLDLSFKFDKDGGGQVTLRRPPGTTCRGAVRGYMDGGKLAIQGDQPVPCSDGGRYGAPKIECARDDSGKTQCFGINADGSRYFMGMQRQ